MVPEVFKFSFLNKKNIRFTFHDDRSHSFSFQKLTSSSYIHGSDNHFKQAKNSFLHFLPSSPRFLKSSTLSKRICFPPVTTTPKAAIAGPILFPPSPSKKLHCLLLLRRMSDNSSCLPYRS